MIDGRKSDIPAEIDCKKIKEQGNKYMYIHPCHSNVT